MKKKGIKFKYDKPYNMVDIEQIKHEKPERTLMIKIICIAGLIITLLEIVGHFYTTQFRGNGYENKSTIYLKVIPFINLLCWAGFWTLRKATIILFVLNLSFTLWIHYHIGIPLFDFYTCLFILVTFLILGQLHAMKRFI